MRFHFRTRPSPIAIDLTPTHIRAVQCGWNGGESLVSGSAAIRRNEASAIPAAREIARLKQVLDRNGFVGRRIILSLPQDKQIGGVISIPSGASVPVRDLARIELARTTRRPPDSFEFECWPLPPSPSETSASALVIGSAHSDLMPLLAAFEDHGFEAVAVRSRTAALLRAAPAMPDDAISVILEIDWSSTTLVLIHGGAPVYERRLADGCLNVMIDGLQRRLGLDDDVSRCLIHDMGIADATADHAVARQAQGLLSAHIDALAAEVAASLAYEIDRYPTTQPGTIWLCGVGASTPGVAARLSQILRIEARSLSATGLVSDPDLAVATGLALSANALDSRGRIAA